MQEFHNKPYSRYHGYQKMVETIRKQYRQPKIKTNIVEFITKCIECQNVKIEHQHLACSLQQLSISEWKLEVLFLDFIIRLPKTKRKHDCIMVVVDKLSKVVGFIPIKSTFKAINIAKIFMKEVFILHRVPKIIISNRDTKFTSKFQEALFGGLDTQLGFSTTYHLQIDRKTERTNQILDDMLIMYEMDKLNKWEDYLWL